jgi:hypothetical protein
MTSKWSRVALAALLGIAVAASALADEIVLKNGRQYSGKFVRGDADAIEFQIQGRVQIFQISEVSEIVFKQPEIVTPPAPLRSEAPPRQVPPQNPPPDRDVQPASTARSSAGATITLPVGTAVTIRTLEAIDTDRNRAGDAFAATVDEPISVGSQIIIPRGASVQGQIAYAKESGRIAGQSELILELAEITVAGKSYPVRTSNYSEVGASRGRRTAATAGGGAAIGAIIGGIAGGGRGAAIGAATGGAAGTGVTVLSRGQTLKIPAETALEFRLESPLSIDAP